MTSRETLISLCEQCKAVNLPKSVKSSTRKQIFEASRQARGWLDSSFFSESSSETAYHIERITQLMGLL